MFVIQKQRKLEKENMKKLNFILILSLILLGNYNKAFALTPALQSNISESIKVEKAEENNKELSIIKKISLRNKFRKSPENQIIDFFEKFDKYSEKNNIDKLKGMYDDNYINNDGFDKETMFKMIDMSSNLYKNIEYKTNLDKIVINGNYATAKGHEISTGETVKTIKGIEGTGLVSSNVEYTNYLRKDGNKWKLIATDITSESVMLKYGEAKNMPVEIMAPECVKSATEYEISVKADPPSESFMVGSITNDPIVFPIAEKKDVYRAFKSNELARVIKSNSDNHNEYATVSLAVTRANIEPPSVVINMTGIAFIMKRVNVIHVKDKNNLNGVNLNGNTEK